MLTNTKICGEIKQNLNEFALAYTCNVKVLIKVEKIVSYKVNVLYIVDQAHQRCVIVKTFSRQLTHNPWITTPKTKQRLSPISGKRKGKLFFENLRKRKKLKKLVKQKKQSSNYNERGRAVQGEDMYLPEPTIIHKMFETSCSFHEK